MRASLLHLIKICCISQVLLVLCTVIVPCITTECSWRDSHLHLMAQLFDNYSKDTRPGEDGRPTAVDIIMTPVTLISLDEETEAAQVKSAIEFSWSDPYLAWDPADYNGISKIFKLQSELWVPTVYISNSLEKSNSFEFCDDSKIPIHSDGSMQWTIIENTLTSCPIDTRFYPFDIQTCQIILQFYPLSTSDLRINEHYFHSDPADFESGGTWELIDARSSINEGSDGRYTYNIIQYHLVLRRRPLFHVINVILPVIFLSMTTTVVFLLPAEAGEKMGVSMTVLLAYSVYLSIISDDLPQTSVQVCYLQVYLISLLAVTALGVMVSVVILKVHHRSPEIPVGRKTRECIRYIRSALCLSGNRETATPKTMDFSPDDLKLPDNNNGETMVTITATANRTCSRGALCGRNTTGASQGTICQKENGKGQEDGIASQEEHGKRHEYVSKTSPDVFKASPDVFKTSPDANISWPCVAETLDRLVFTAFSVLIVSVSVVTFCVITTGARGMET